MIDLHTHILPGIDDGSQTMEDSIKMAKIAFESGVHTLVVTPHSNIEGVFDNYYDDSLVDRFIDLEMAIAIEQIPIKLVLGMEIYGSEEVPYLLQKRKLISLNYTRYLLMEFSFQEDIALMEYLIYEITHQGFTPIIAHPERYPFIQSNPRTINRWITEGCIIQVNKGSILGNFGYKARNTALYLLEHNLVSLIASDAHSYIQRTTEMSQIYSFVSNKYTAYYAGLLLEENPRCVIENKDLIELPNVENNNKIYFY